MTAHVWVQRDQNNVASHLTGCIEVLHNTAEAVAVELGAGLQSGLFHCMALEYKFYCVWVGAYKYTHTHTHMLENHKTRMEQAPVVRL